MQQSDLLRHAVDALESHQIPYMVVGSMASMIYGEPRSTNDIDIVIRPTPEQLDLLCDSFPEADFYVSREAAHSALRNGGQFNVIDPTSANKIDFMIARTDAWGHEQLARRRRLRVLPDREGFAARPEDIILSKMAYFAEGGSEKHLRDIASMLRISGSQIDRDYIQRWATDLGLTDVWQRILQGPQ